MKVEKYMMHHCLRSSLGGEEVALERVAKLSENIHLIIYGKRNIFISVLIFMFSTSYAKSVTNGGRGTRYIFSNPFPYVSIPSILILKFKKIPLRWFVHNFSSSCPANSHFRKEDQCFESSRLKSRKCFNISCNNSISHYVLNYLRNVVFYKIFISGAKNKLYFVSRFQSELSVKSGLPRSKFVIVGNVL